jgi:hypothetical protein
MGMPGGILMVSVMMARAPFLSSALSVRSSRHGMPGRAVGIPAIIAASMLPPMVEVAASP